MKNVLAFRPTREMIKMLRKLRPDINKLSHTDNSSIYTDSKITIDDQSIRTSGFMKIPLVFKKPEVDFSIYTDVIIDATGTENDDLADSINLIIERIERLYEVEFTLHLLNPSDSEIDVFSKNHKVISYQKYKGHYLTDSTESIFSNVSTDILLTEDLIKQIDEYAALQSMIYDVCEMHKLDLEYYMNIIDPLYDIPSPYSEVVADAKEYEMTCFDLVTKGGTLHTIIKNAYDDNDSEVLKMFTKLYGKIILFAATTNTLDMRFSMTFVGDIYDAIESVTGFDYDVVDMIEDSFLDF